MEDFRFSINAGVSLRAKRSNLVARGTLHRIASLRFAPFAMTFILDSDPETDIHVNLWNPLNRRLITVNATNATTNPYNVIVIRRLPSQRM